MTDMSEPTEDQMRDAWRALATDEWGEYDQVKRAARHWALVRLRAGLIARGERVDAAPPEVHAPAVQAVAAPPPPAFWGSLRAPNGPIFDNKRAASGDRDED